MTPNPTGHHPTNVKESAVNVRDAIDLAVGLTIGCVIVWGLRR